jgi:AcrR family transcriptional regulator
MDPMAYSDPRAVRSREAILDAARALLVERGPAAVTHVLVADSARVGRATVYRHWPRSEDLLVEAMAGVPMPFFADPTSPVRQWLMNELTIMARQLERDDVRAVATTLANTALWDTEMDARRQLFSRTISDRLVAALELARDRGELRVRGDVQHAAARAIGPLYYRTTIEHELIDEVILDDAMNALGEWSEVLR